MDAAPISRGELAYLIGTPLVWAIVLLFHAAGPDSDIYSGISDDAELWILSSPGASASR